MKPKYSMFFSALAVSFGLLWAPAEVLADPSTATQAGNPFYPAPPPSITGTVTNNDPVNKTIQVREKSGELKTVVIDDSVSVMKKGQTVMQQDLDVGDAVKVKSEVPPSSNP